MRYPCRPSSRVAEKFVINSPPLRLLPANRPAALEVRKITGVQHSLLWNFLFHFTFCVFVWITVAMRELPCVNFGKPQSTITECPKSFGSVLIVTLSDGRDVARRARRASRPPYTTRICDANCCAPQPRAAACRFTPCLPQPLQLLWKIFICPLSDAHNHNLPLKNVE